MAVKRIKGVFYVDNINIEKVEELVSRFDTIQEFLAHARLANSVLVNIRNDGKVTMSTIDKLLSAFDELEPKDLILDYKEEDYFKFDIDLTKYRPTDSDLKDSEHLMQAYSRTIKEHLRLLNVEKREKILRLLKRLMLESQYYGVLLEKMGKSVYLIKNIEEIRNKGDKK